MTPELPATRAELAAYSSSVGARVEMVEKYLSELSASDPGRAAIIGTKDGLLRYPFSIEMHLWQFSRDLAKDVQRLSAENERLRKESEETSRILDEANRGLDDIKRTILTLTAERDEARDWVRRMHQDRQTLTCVYCGHAYPPGTPASGSEVLTAHIRVCEKHPMRGLVALWDLCRPLAVHDPRVADLAQALGLLDKPRDPVAESERVGAEKEPAR